ncbi:MAG: FeoB-associated Cys-rich membrane protein [Lachnospiraceae bacterium]|nr:FeoB-associated Cys-rich membrane protein [Lachnospiraceae bacterium]
MGTILVSVILILIVTCIIMTLIKDKKQGRSSCGGNCANCRMCCSACKKPVRK